MTLSRPIALLRFALRARDIRLATALAHAIGPAADRELRSMPRLPATGAGRPLLAAVIDAVASA